MIETKKTLFALRVCGLSLVSLLLIVLVVGSAAAEEIRVMTSGGFTAPYNRVIPEYERASEDTVLTAYGASMGGAPRHPIWYHNLKANPEIEVRVKGTVRKLIAQEVDAEEKAKLWPVCCEHYPEYATYQKRTDRDIPVFNCQPNS